MSQIVEIDDKIEVDKISVEEVNTDNNIEIDKLIDNDKSPHNGEPITLFKGISIYDTHSKLEITQNSTKWEIISLSDNNKIKLQVIKKIKVGNSWDIRYTRAQNFKLLHNNLRLYKMKLFNDSDIIILTTMGLLIYHFNDDDKSISLNYFYYMDLFFNKKGVKYYKKVFSKDTLPLPNYDSFKYNDEWISHIKNNKECLLKYGVGLLKFAIKEHNLDLIEEIYEKCIIHFKEDLKNNVKFLSIITSTIPLLNKHYPEYIAKYLLDTAMIIDSSVYNIERLNGNLHLYSFQHSQIVNFTCWEKYDEFLFYFEYNYKIMFWIVFVIQVLITLPLLPIYYAIFNILPKRYNNKFGTNMIPFLYFLILKTYSKEMSTLILTPTITFMNPYINFINYPKNYNWLLELIKPQSSPFVKAINNDIYKTWDGETIINFKWNTYGKYYYIIIWIGFIALLGCFTTAATIPQQYINDNIQKQLLITSIILGFIHLSFEVRQFIYNPNKWFRNFWNIFDIIAFLLPIYTSIYWLQTDKRNIELLSFTCLFLDIKFLLFFRVFESFGIYFAIIISVGKQIISFLVVLLIIIISFAHAFYILLSPKTNITFNEFLHNNDSNNPWNIVPTYIQVFENGTNNSNPILIQQPDGNTNMFVNFKTALFAMYLFLTGDSSALSNWSYIDNSALTIMIVLFSLLIVIYLMNLFIGLLNIAIEKDNNRVSYLIQKAEILAEIELFYLLPYQRRWNTWFPEIIYYYASVDKSREKVKDMINKGEWNTNKFPELKEDLLSKLNIQSVNKTNLQ
ncbi:hypothetical protein RhiirB3_445628 [Rhizophagus irregularis]|nr:hypothetical protein RhiirB3_445628 [Rhizophagus irregularis]